VFVNFNIELTERNYNAALKHLSNLDDPTTLGIPDYWRSVVYRLMNQPGPARTAFESARRLEKNLMQYPEDSWAHRPFLGEPAPTGSCDRLSKNILTACTE
jgi:hypothetical protein